jgi:hypothetical protein
MMKRYQRNQGRVAAATGRWLSSAHIAEQNLAKYPNNYMILRYETLASCPEETLKEVCAFIGEAYYPAMLSMDAVPEMKERGGNSSYGQFERAKISTRSVGRFREVLSDPEILFIQMFAKHEMDHYGYEPIPIQLSGRGRLAFYTTMLPLNSLRLAGWRVLQSIAQKREPVPPSKILAEVETGA